MRLLRLIMLVAVLAGGLSPGCGTSPASREAIVQAWAERDAERARECAQKGGRWATAGCIYRGGP